MLSERAIKRLAEVITGDARVSPYRSGPKLVSFFNQFGLNHVYSDGFPARWSFAEDCIRKLNNTKSIPNVIRAALDPRDFRMGVVRDLESGENRTADIQEAVAYLNEIFEFDGQEIVADGRFFKIFSKHPKQIDLDVKLESNHLSREFILEQITKCRSKIAEQDFDGAITNARSLVEAVLTAIERECDSSAPPYDGELQKLFKRIQGHLNLSPENPQISENLKQTLRGFINIINGLSGLSNKMGDRHVREYKPAQHHAVLIVNTAMTLSNFIFDTYSYQKNRGGRT